MFFSPSSAPLGPISSRMLENRRTHFLTSETWLNMENLFIQFFQQIFVSNLYYILGTMLASRC